MTDLTMAPNKAALGMDYERLTGRYGVPTTTQGEEAHWRVDQIEQRHICAGSSAVYCGAEGGMSCWR